MKAKILIRMQGSSVQIQRLRRKVKRKSSALYFILISALIVSFCLIMSCGESKNQFLTKSETQLLDLIDKKENIFEGKYILNPN